MAKTLHHKQKKHPFNLPSPGSSPGVIYIGKDVLAPRITLHCYDTKVYNVHHLKSLSELKAYTKNPNFSYWVEIQGYNSSALFDTLNEEYKINKLVLEDITSPYHRPKYEEYGHYDFAISRILRLDDRGNFENEQFSFILMENILITFQETYEAQLQPVKRRLEGGKGNIRLAGSSYLMYAIMDMIIDGYFGVLNTWNNQLDELEDQLLIKPKKHIMVDTQYVKRNLIMLRRVIWPERDKINDILRTESALISSQAKLFIRDAYDHCIQLIDMTESLKELSASIMDMYLSIMSNRMNEIMKVLTVISSVFIPLTFIVGIYGMNFSRVDPVTGKVLPLNMPELYWEHGYLNALALMALIAIIQIIFFWRKGWFK